MNHKQFEVADHGLWDDLSLTIKPLGKKSKARISQATRPQQSGPAANSSMAKPAFAPISRKIAPRHEPPSLSAFDRRTAQKLSRGISEPDARIDLHGEGVETARIKLLHFIEQQRDRGARLVLVISGKGASPFARHTLHGLTHFHAPEREGRLRREVPQWLHEAPFRIHVVGFQPAHPRHGGGGAFYVRLRKAGDRA